MKLLVRPSQLRGQIAHVTLTENFIGERGNLLFEDAGISGESFQIVSGNVYQQARQGGRVDAVEPGESAKPRRLEKAGFQSTGQNGADDALPMTHGHDCDHDIPEPVQFDNAGFAPVWRPRDPTETPPTPRRQPQER
jgi:hypothetical protein